MKGGKRRVSSPPPGGSILRISAPRSPRLWVANGPARTRVRSITRIPSSGPTQSPCSVEVMFLLLLKLGRHSCESGNPEPRLPSLTLEPSQGLSRGSRGGDGLCRYL